MQQFLERFMPSIVEFSVFLSAIFAFYALLKWTVLRMRKQASLKSSDWRLHIESIVMRPTHVLLGIVVLTTSAAWVLDELGGSEGIRSFFPVLRDSGIVACLTWCAFRGKKVAYDSLLNRRVQGKILLDPASLSFLDKLATLFTCMIALLFILHIVGLNILPLVTFGGIGAATMAFASKDIFSNFFSGLMLHMTRPFTVNDQVELPGKKVTGRVEEIGWCLTVVRDLQKRPIYLPNSLFSSEVLINISRMTHRRIEESIRFRCTDGSALAAYVKLVRECLDSHPQIDHHLPVYAFLNALGSSFAEIEIKAYTISADYEEFVQAKQDVLLKVHQIVGASQAGSLLLGALKKD
jgi:Small-conductance mechanosensitive channel